MNIKNKNSIKDNNKQEDVTWKDIALLTFSDNLSSVYTGQLYEWAKYNVNLPSSYAIQGAFNIDNSPYLKMPMEYLLKPNIRQINAIAATQTGKTLIRELMIPYIILLEPGPILCLSQNDDVAKHLTETRLIPLLKNNKKINALLENDRFQARKSGIVFPHMAIKCCGGSENNLHSLSIKYLFIDETWLMDAGVIQKAKARTTAFNNTKKIYISSQPGTKGDDTSREIEKSEVYEWYYKCKHCNVIQPYIWYGEKDNKKYGMIWDKKLRSDGTFDMDGTASTSRLVCSHCHGEIIDTHDNRRQLNDGRYVKVKDGNSENVTFMWSAFVNPTISFKQMTMQYLEAMNIYKRTGNDDTYKLFVQQVLGKEWDKQGVIEAPRILNYIVKKDETWSDETHRFMSVDYQKINGVRYYTIRAWSSKTNESRLLKRGYVTNWEEVADLAREYKLPPYCVGVDSGYNATEVYAASIQHGQLMMIGKNRIYASWLCFKGDGQKTSYKHKDESWKYYSQEVKGDPNFSYGHKFKGINGRLYLWSNHSIKTILANLRDNKIENYKWMADISDKVYIEQMHSEVLKDFIDPKTNTTKQIWVKSNDNNHYWDCECMNLVMAIMGGAYNTGQVECLCPSYLNEDNTDY